MSDNGHPLRDGLSPTVEPVPVSLVPASIPDARKVRDRELAWLRIAYRALSKMSWEGQLRSLDYLANRLQDEAAKAMETGTAKTEGLGAKHDSAAPSGVCPKEGS